MSRIGKLPIAIPAGVKVSLLGSLVTVEGPKGKLSRDHLGHVGLDLTEGEIKVRALDSSGQAGAYHGLYRTLINNMVVGVSQGFSKVLVISGVGYRAEVKDGLLLLNLGYSMTVEYAIEKDLAISTEGPNKIIISGADKEKVGQASSEIRSIRPPEPYKGKGIRYETETIVHKVGKSGVK
ncbi:MAG: 50S ribosomal protein L6 [Spirochaetales bacterium]|jgi:large subunit ribosomal protein L6|nr:50S ribosomal protein L6 [Spirochaetales bacterium]